jgi:hypothetical protein
MNNELKRYNDQSENIQKNIEKKLKDIKEGPKYIKIAESFFHNDQKRGYENFQSFLNEIEKLKDEAALLKNTKDIIAKIETSYLTVLLKIIKFNVNKVDLILNDKNLDYKMNEFEKINNNIKFFLYNYKDKDVLIPQFEDSFKKIDALTTKFILLNQNNKDINSSINNNIELKELSIEGEIEKYFVENYFNRDSMIGINEVTAELNSLKELGIKLVENNLASKLPEIEKRFRLLVNSHSQKILEFFEENDFLFRKNTLFRAKKNLNEIMPLLTVFENEVISNVNEKDNYTYNFIKINELVDKLWKISHIPTEIQQEVKQNNTLENEKLAQTGHIEKKKAIIQKNDAIIKAKEFNFKEIVFELRKKYELILPKANATELSKEEFDNEIIKILSANISSIEKVNILKDLEKQKLFGANQISFENLSPIQSLNLFQECLKNNLINKNNFEQKFEELFFKNINLLDYNHKTYLEPATNDIIEFILNTDKILLQKNFGYNIKIKLNKFSSNNIDLTSSLKELIKKAYREDTISTNSKEIVSPQNYSIIIKEVINEINSFKNLDELVSVFHQKMIEKQINLNLINKQKFGLSLLNALKLNNISNFDNVNLTSKNFTDYLYSILKSSQTFNIDPKSLITKELEISKSSLTDNNLTLNYNLFLANINTDTNYTKLRNIVIGHAWEKHKYQFESIGIKNQFDLYKIILETVFSKTTDKRTKQKEELMDNENKNHVFTAYINKSIVPQKMNDKRKFALLITIDDLNNDNGSAYLAPLEDIDNTYKKVLT